MSTYDLANNILDLRTQLEQVRKELLESLNISLEEASDNPELRVETREGSLLLRSLVPDITAIIAQKEYQALIESVGGISNLM